MNTRTVILAVAMGLLPVGTSSQPLPDLIVDTSQEVTFVAGAQYLRHVEIIRGATLAPTILTRQDGLVITCASFVLDSSSTVSAGASTGKVYWGPLGWETREPGTPEVTAIMENGEVQETRGNGSGSFGGKGFNAFDTPKPTYADPTGFDITQGSRGTPGETVRFWFGGRPNVLPGMAGGRGGGMIYLIANELTIEGRVSADGESGFGDACLGPAPGYSGSGGGVLIAARNLTITGTAQITANGGFYAVKTPPDCEFPVPLHFQWAAVGKRDGGGGRIKIFYEEGAISPEAVIEAKGWEDGTVHIEQVPSIDELLKPKADLNRDGFVDHRDLLLFHKEWQQALTPIPVPAETATPTPGP